MSEVKQSERSESKPLLNTMRGMSGVRTDRSLCESEIAMHRHGDTLQEAGRS